jgi:hypothetical protein
MWVLHPLAAVEFAMKIRAVLALLSVCAATTVALAETVAVDDKVAVRESNVPRPDRGMQMSAVEQKFGAPVTKHAAVGGASAHQPPITRWDYNGFAVFFERDRVIHSVTTGG